MKNSTIFTVIVTLVVAIVIALGVNTIINNYKAERVALADNINMIVQAGTCGTIKKRNTIGSYCQHSGVWYMVDTDIVNAKGVSVDAVNENDIIVVDESAVPVSIIVLTHLDQL